MKAVWGDLDKLVRKGWGIPAHAVMHDWDHILAIMEFRYEYKYPKGDPNHGKTETRAIRIHISAPYKAEKFVVIPETLVSIGEHERDSE